MQQRASFGAHDQELYGAWARAPRDLVFDEVGRADLADARDDIVALTADMGRYSDLHPFRDRHPDRFFNIGIAESNLVGVAAGLASSGKMSLIASFAAFITCNGYDQLRMSVAYPRLNVKVVGSHAGISIGEDGEVDPVF